MGGCAVRQAGWLGPALSRGKRFESIHRLCSTFDHMKMIGSGSVAGFQDWPSLVAGIFPRYGSF